MLKTYFFTITTLFLLLPLSQGVINLSETFFTENSPSSVLVDSSQSRHKYRANNQTVQTREIPFSPQSEKESGYKIRKIVIDPGHGGHDGGCSGAHSTEKHLALAVAKKMKAAIHASHPDVQVIMTREIDVFIPLYQRAAIANDNQADLFISVHCNSIRNAGHIRGSETYVLGAHKFEENLDVAKRENAAVLYEDNYEKNYNFDPNSDEGHITLSLYQNAYLEQSLLFAERVETNIKNNTAMRSRGVKQAGFLVLRETAMPSVLIETGYLTNGKDEAYLRSEAGQNKMAAVIARAFTEYRNIIESESGLAGNTVVRPPARSGSGGTPYRRQEVRQIQKPVIIQNTSTSSAPRRSEVKSPAVSRPTVPKVNTTGTSIRYRVQLAASSTPLNTTQGRWLSIPEYTVAVINENGMKKYQASDFSTFAEANAARKILTQRGFRGAFVTAYENGRKISVQEAKNKE